MNDKKKKIIGIILGVIVLIIAGNILFSSGILSKIPLTGFDLSSKTCTVTVDIKDLKTGKSLSTTDYPFNKGEKVTMTLPTIKGYTRENNESKKVSFQVNGSDRGRITFYYVKETTVTLKILDPNSKLLKTQTYYGASNASQTVKAPSVKGYVYGSGTSIKLNFKENNTTASVKYKKTVTVKAYLINAANKKRLKTVSFTGPSHTKVTMTLPKITNYVRQNDASLKQSISFGSKNSTITIKYVTFESEVTKRTLALINKERRGLKGRKQLTYNAVLYTAANKRADEIVKKFSHVRPNGKKFYTIVDGKKLKDDPKYTGENLASMPLRDSAQKQATELYNAWKKSSAHHYVYTHKQIKWSSFGYTKKGNKLYICNLMY